MVSISDAELVKFNEAGLIPGPEESEERFLQRANHCLGLSALLFGSTKSEIPFGKEHLDSGAVLEDAIPIAKKLYDIQPAWIPIFFSDFQLAPWHGGCAWIFQLTEDGPLGAFLQLRHVFRSNAKYLGLYSRDELVAHELSHVGRMAFEEPRFEEVHAYRASHAKWRQWLGPVVQSARESMLFVLLLFLIFTLDVYLILTGQSEAYMHFFWLKAIPAALAVYALIRLWYRQRTFDKCLQNLTKALGEADKANGVLYRLTDQEIKEFATWSPQEIMDFASTQGPKSLRWRLLNVAYFHPSSRFVH